MALLIVIPGYRKVGLLFAFAVVMMVERKKMELNRGESPVYYQKGTGNLSNCIAIRTDIISGRKVPR